MRFSAYELRRLELAEQVCPWGEVAETHRAVYLVDSVAAMLGGDKNAAREARQILNSLLGSQPAKRRTLAAQLGRRKGV